MKPTRYTWNRLVMQVALALALSLMAARADQTFTVTNHLDSGTGTLRWALAQPCTGTRSISFGFKETTIALASTLNVTGTVIISGTPNASYLNTNHNGFRVTISGGGSVRPFTVPAGVMLSNGPADPAALHYAIATIRGLLGKVPIMGICLGHQLLGLALGGKTCRLKFGHHGCNHPVMDVRAATVEITSQNHNYRVDADSLDPAEAEITHVSLNDRTVEGLEAKKVPAFSLQYHPEAAPGPHDAIPAFSRFRAMGLFQIHKSSDHAGAYFRWMQWRVWVAGGVGKLGGGGNRKALFEVMNNMPEPVRMIMLRVCPFGA